MLEPPRKGLTRVHHTRYAAQAIAERRDKTVTVCVPTRNEAAAIGRTVSVLEDLRRAGAIDQVLVADDSTDETPILAAEQGAEVVRQDELLPEFGPILGKGDAMWRALSVCSGEVICFVDGDSTDFGPRFPLGLVGAVALDGYSFAKGTFRRPFEGEGQKLSTGGGRVTELTAKPLLRRLAPELAGFSQPLAGEIAAEATLLNAIPMAMGYSVDVAILIDVWRRVGLASIVEVDLDCRQNTHQALEHLAPMSDEVAHAILDRAPGSEARLELAGVPIVNRPPMRTVRERPPALRSAA